MKQRLIISILDLPSIISSLWQISKLTVQLPDAVLYNSNEKTRIRDLRVELHNGQWLLYPGTSSLGVRLAEEDRWWEHIDALGPVARARGWCLFPWGPLSTALRLFGVLAEESAELPAPLRYSDATTVPVERLQDIIISSAQYPAPEAQFIVEHRIGETVVDEFFRDGKRPNVVFSSPEGTLFLIEMALQHPLTMPELLEQVEFVSAIDGSRSQRMPWICRPNSRNSFLELCDLSAHRPLLGGNVNERELARLVSNEGGFSLANCWPVGRSKDLLFMTPYGELDFRTSVIMGRQVRALAATGQRSIVAIL